MKTARIAWLAAAACILALPALAWAAPNPFAKGRTKAIKTQIAQHLSTTRYIPPNVRMAPISASQIRIRTRVDKSHGRDGHVHIVGHQVRSVSFKALGLGRPVAGKAASDTLFLGQDSRNTSVSNIRVLVPKSWGQPPAAARVDATR